MTKLSQANRLLSISDISLGKDTFLLTQFAGSEGISEPFHFSVEALSENLDINPSLIVGKSVTVAIQNDVKRKFNGIISKFYFGEIQKDNLRLYKMEIVPKFFLLKKTNNNRVFQNKSSKDIIIELLSEKGISDIEYRAGTGKLREYCVQYNESDFNFICRLLEEDGISYYFTHEDGKHTIIFVDSASGFMPVDEKEVEYSKGSSTHAQITLWENSLQYRKGKWSLNDYNFKEPKKILLSSISSHSDLPSNHEYEHYQYPGLYDLDSGGELTKIALEAEETTRNIYSGESGCSSFFAGGKFTLAKHDTASQKGQYTIIRVMHEAKDSSYFSGIETDTYYKNNFSCVPFNTPIRPKKIHKKSIVPGPQSAVVVGPAGEDIFIDEHGRVKIQFIWDREGVHDENSSCFVRVVQSWAGNQWGTSFIPRIGQEVIVNHLDGDPDRPLIIGAVYNGDNKPVYSSKTQSGIKTRSTKGGTRDNFNELRFDDLKGEEQIYLHAERNFDTHVENDQTLRIDRDRTKTVLRDENSSIENDRNKKVGVNQSEVIGNDKTIEVGNNHNESIGNNMTLSIEKNKTLDIGNDISINVGGNHNESIDKNMILTVGKDLRESIEGQHSQSVTKDYSLKAKTITLNGDDKITLRSGSSTIVLSNNGDITISGKNISLKGSGNIVLNGSKVTSN